MNIAVDTNIPKADVLFSEFGKLYFFSPEEMNNKFLIDNEIDILLIRSTVKVNTDLIKNTKLKFIGTATIGTDHVDLDCLKKSGIHFVSAAGCNSKSVAEYVAAAIFELCSRFSLDIRKLSLGIVGYGNIGTRVYKMFKGITKNILINDPPKSKMNKDFKWSSLEEVLEKGDIITFHVPLTFSGEYPTYHLVGENELGLLKERCILINTSRGPVVDNTSLKKVLSKKELRVVLDVWENEPDIDVELLDMVCIGTMHIAGYSYEGKLMGTYMVYQKFCEYFGFPKRFAFEDIIEKVNYTLKIPTEEKNTVLSVNRIIKNSYDICEDHRLLMGIKKYEGEGKNRFFRELRKNYRIRREFSNYTLKFLSDKDRELACILKQLGFKILQE